MILVDTSGLLAAFFADQRQHEECARILREAEPPRYISPFVIAEADDLIQKYGGVEAELLFLEELSRGAYFITNFEPRATSRRPGRWSRNTATSGSVWPTPRSSLTPGSMIAATS